VDHSQLTLEPAQADAAASDPRSLVWVAFAVMIALIGVIVATTYWACKTEVAAFQRGLDLAGAQPPSADTFAAIAAFASGVMSPYTKTISILLSFLLIFAGTVYVLLPVRARYRGSAEGMGHRGLLQSDSPGLIMIRLGVFLAAVAVLHQVSLDYKATGPAQDGVAVTSQDMPAKPAIAAR
jgi:hypothetical protein